MVDVTHQGHHWSSKDQIFFRVLDLIQFIER